MNDNDEHQLRETIHRLTDLSRKQSNLLMLAWGVIANAGGGDWTVETKEWQKAAAGWRDQYHSPVGSENTRDGTIERLTAANRIQKSALERLHREKAVQSESRQDSPAVEGLWAREVKYLRGVVARYREMLDHARAARVDAENRLQRIRMELP